MEPPFSSPSLSPPERFTSRWGRLHPPGHLNSLLPPPPPTELLDTRFRSHAFMPRLRSRFPAMRPQRTAVFQPTRIVDGGDVEPIEISPTPSSGAVVMDNEDVEEVLPAFLPRLRMRANRRGHVMPQIVGEIPSQPKVAVPEFRQMERLIGQLRILQQRRAAERASGTTTKVTKPDDVHFEECIICYEPLTAPECSVTKCGHVFHTHCILACTSGRQRSELECPVCRQPAHVPELVQIHNGLPSKSTVSSRLGEESPFPKVQPEQSEVVVISDGEDSPVCVTSSRPALASHPNGTDLDAALINTLHNINNGLQRSVEKFSNAESKVIKDFTEKERRRELEHLSLMESLRKETSKLKDEKRELEKQETDIKSRRECLQNEKENLDKDRKEYEEARKQLSQIKLKLEEDMDNVAKAQEEVNRARASAMKREQRLQRLTELKKRPREEITSKKVVSSDQTKDSDVPSSNALCELSKFPPGDETVSCDPSGNEMEHDVMEPTNALPSLKKAKIIKDGNSSVINSTNDVSVPSVAQTLETAPVFGPNLHSQPATPTAPCLTRAKGTGRPVSRGPGLSAFTASRPKVQLPAAPIGKRTTSTLRPSKR